MIVADIGRAVLLISVPAAALLHVLGLPQLYAVGFLLAMLSTIFEVADRSFLPTVVGGDEILPANAALTASSAVAEFGAFGVSGFLVQLVTAPIAVVAGALTFLWSAFFIGRIRSPEPPPTPSADREPVLREIRDGLGLLFGDPILRPIALASACLGGLYGIIGATYLLFANQTLGLSPAVIGIVAGIGGAGSLIGAVLAGRITRRFGLGRALVWAPALGSLGNFFIPLAPAGLPLVAIGCLLAQQVIGDSAITVFEIDDVTVRQSVVPDRRLGRVNASSHVLERRGAAGRNRPRRRCWPRHRNPWRAGRGLARRPARGGVHLLLAGPPAAGRAGSACRRWRPPVTGHPGRGHPPRRVVAGQPRSSARSTALGCESQASDWSCATVRGTKVRSLPDHRSGVRSGVGPHHHGMTLDHTAVGAAVPIAPELPSLEDLPSLDPTSNLPPPPARIAAPLRPLDSAWLERWSAQLNPRHQPSVSGAAWVSALLRIAPDASATRDRGFALPPPLSPRAPAADLSAPCAHG